ncbi:MAG: hypothetical protein M1826_004739 [Phylliscum demangeonii]|nr:MAG: hypothetical protein M1826_004739 [Phylliscum demangeonii]
MNSRAVNRPTDPRKRDADISRKLQLYGIYSAFTNGKVPSNKQIDIALNSASAHRMLAKPSSKLSGEGQHLIADVRDVIEQAKILLLTKNEGNLLQDFIWHCEQLGSGNASLPNAPVEKGTAQQHGSQALDGLRTLGTLVISNGEFRKLLNDATVLLRDMAGDAAQTAANKINPSQDQLSQIDRPAEENTWHDTPDLSRQNLKDRALNTFNKNKPFDRQDLKEAAGDATQAAHPTGSRDPKDAANLAANDQRDGTSSGVDGRAGLGAGLSSLKEKASNNVPDDVQDQAKDRARNAAGQTREYLDKKMPQERRDQAIWRLKKMIVEIQGHQDYQRAIETLLNLAETYTGYAQNVTQQSAGAVRGAHADDHLRLAEGDLKLLIERFANNTSSDDIFDAINAIYRDADRDPELKGWFRRMTAFVRRCLKTQGYVMQDESTDEWHRLYDQGQYLLRDKYRDHSNRVLDEIKYLAEQFDHDQHNKRFGQSLQKLFNDLGNDENGKPTFKPHLIKDLTDVILPDMFESIAYVPLPRIEYSDPMMDAVVENLIIESDNLMPNVFEFGSDNYVRWGRKQVASKLSSKTLLSVSGVQMDLRDVSYYVKKKQGFPSITDLGVADIFMGGQGFSFKVKMATAEKSDRQHFFKIEKIDVDVKNLNIKLKQSRHKLAFNIFKPLLFRVIRPVIQKVLEKQIRNTVTQADEMAYSIHVEAQRNARATDPTSPQNFYQRYYEAAQKRFLQGKEKTQDAAKDKKVNIAVTAQDSMFPHIKLPGGISTKATEYKDLAAKGDKWESPVFTIGSAKESTNLPKPSPVRRRGQNASGAGATSGFSSQVDQSFGTQQDLSLSQSGRANGTLNGTSDYPTGGATTGGATTTGYATGTGGKTSGYPTTGTGATGTGASGTTSGYSTGATGASSGYSSGAATTGVASDYPATSGTSGVSGGAGTTLLGSANPVLTGAA